VRNLLSWIGQEGTDYRHGEQKQRFLHEEMTHGDFRCPNTCDETTQRLWRDNSTPATCYALNYYMIN